MTENKRFILDKETNILSNNGENWAYWNVEQEKIIEKLNQLNDENESLERRLKSTVEMLCVLNRSNKKQEEQNEQLKKQNERLKLKLERERNSYYKQHKKWESEILTENEQLKAEIEEYKAILKQKEE